MVTIIESQTGPTCEKKLPVNLTQKDFTSRLLGRDTTPIYTPAAQDLIFGKVILVTGAGGSIGSEIVRQLLHLGAKKIYCLDNDEYSLYNLSLELNGNALLTDDRFILADIKDKTLITRIFSRIHPDIVYHAAAHKHLPLLERSPVAAIKTNVLGTDNIASSCIRFGVKYFVNISTDKAARPISTLGMSKRLAELCTAGYKAKKTKVASVRFGNVLGSRGSFLPTLVWQIDNGKPITVTDPDVTRFFMTIPEAAALVIEASALSEGGETFVLDMGKPIKIMDLIDRYVEISGCNKPEIIFTGLRPGEKLHEELFDPSEVNLPTMHPRVTKANVDESGKITTPDKMFLRDLVRSDLPAEELKEKILGLIHAIENRTLIGSEQSLSGVVCELSELIQ